MPSTVQSAGFFSTFPGERVVAEWEVLSFPRRFYLGDILVALVLGGLGRSMAAAIQVELHTHMTRILADVLTLLPVAVYAAWVFFLRQARSGFLVVTDQRLGYYERAQGPLSQSHALFQVNLDDVVGFNTSYGRHWWAETAGFEILTSHGDDLAVATHRSMPSLPALSGLLKNTMGRDMYASLPRAYGAVDALRSGKEPLP
jgi:hypothetical protein